MCVLRRERNRLCERDSVLNGRGVGEDGVGKKDLLRERPKIGG